MTDEAGPETQDGNAAGGDSHPVPEGAGAPAGDKKEEEKSEDTGNETEPESSAASKSKPIVSSSKKSRPPYKYDPNKITLRFLFANRDGLTVTVECNPTDSVGEVKGALLSVWPDDLPSCSGGDRLRLICMGKGILSPDTSSLESFQIPVFKTHPTPVNVSIKPDQNKIEAAKKNTDSSNHGSNSGPSTSNNAASSGGNTEATSQGCSCVIS